MGDILSNDIFQSDKYITLEYVNKIIVNADQFSKASLRRFQKEFPGRLKSQLFDQQRYLES